MAGAAPHKLHADRCLALKNNPVHHRARHKIDIATRHSRAQIGICRRPAAALPHGHVGRPESFLPVPVIVWRGGIPSCLRCLDKGTVERIVAWPARDMQRPVSPAPTCLTAVGMFHPTEIGQHISIAPAGSTRFLPMRVVTSMAAYIDHAVDRGRPANNLAPRTNKPPPAKCRFRFGKIAPVIAFHVHRVGQRGGHLDQRPGITAPKFQHQNAAAAILAKPIGHGTAGRPRPDDDIVIILFHQSTIWPAPLHVKADARGAMTIKKWG